MNRKHIIAVDQSTSASKVFLLDDGGKIIRRFSRDHRQYYPGSGRVEHDADEIRQNVFDGIRLLASGDIRVSGIAISNQRETTVFWHRTTGEPLCPAVVWQDVRGETLYDDFAPHADRVRLISGLTLSAYFPALKIASKMREEPRLETLAKEGNLCIGTVDSYLIYCLTGGRVFATDVSNASRTQLMEIKSLKWSDELCRVFGIPRDCLPRILPSDTLFGVTGAEGIPQGIPITGVMGDSHAAFFGQGCHQIGMVKATYGTGSSVMMNVGQEPALSSHGLSTSVGYSFRGETCYVLEGNVTSSGDTLKWLRDEAGLVEDIAQVETIAAQCEDSGGVYMVPAFSGLGAPYNLPGARAIICGISRCSTKAHIIRAALESIAYQDADVILAMKDDTGADLSELRVDGGPSANALLMQIQADILGCPVQCAPVSELSALGAGYMAGMTLGVFTDMTDLGHSGGARYEPQKSSSWREEALSLWRRAVHQSAQ
jgi:glycerol kinase